MTRQATLVIQLQSFWHVGTGQGGGPGVDARVALTSGGLPHVPGRALKGLLREAVALATRLGRARGDVTDWFGTDIPRDSGGPETSASRRQEEVRFATRAGSVRVGSAVVGRGDDARAWEAWARSAEGQRLRPHLTRALASTRIEGDGTARDGSLRSIEVAVPMTLHAPVEGPAEALDAIDAALPLIRAVGGHRTRGLGRAALQLERGV